MAEMREADERALVSTNAHEVLEAGALAYEMAKSYRRFVEFYLRECKLEPHEVSAKVQDRLSEGSPEYEQHIKYGPPQEAAWFELEQLTETDPESAAARWLQIKQAARDDLASGHRIARVMEGNANSDPWRRAQFLAIRTSFIEEWRPAGGIEMALIDTMAQAHAAYFGWMDTLATYTGVDFDRRKGQYDKDGYMEPPRISTHVAIQEAAQMADRFNRLFLRTLRQLRDLRRYTSAVTIASAGQVNIGGQQINVAGGEEAK